MPNIQFYFRASRFSEETDSSKKFSFNLAAISSHFSFLHELSQELSSCVKLLFRNYFDTDSIIFRKVA